MRFAGRLLVALASFVAYGLTMEAEEREGVVLLHGLSRTAMSMRGMGSYLKASGFECVNIGYPSRGESIDVLAERVRVEIDRQTADWDRIHFVTHSMGGIIVRQMEAIAPNPKIGRVVMIAPPNQGSEIVDRVGSNWVFRVWNGPAGQQLGTAEDGFIARLGPAKFELGVIAGWRRTPSVFDRWFEGKDDGKVAVERTKLEGMVDFLLVRSGHTFIMGKREVREATLRFLRDGSFQDAG